jgi:hypothetical protein
MKGATANAVMATVVVASTLGSYALSRLTAVKLARQGDVVAKSASEHLEDALVACAGTLAVLPAWHMWHAGLASLAMPVAAAVFAYVSDLPSIRGDLTKPTPKMLAAVAGAALGALGLVAWAAAKHPRGLVPAGLTALAAGGLFLAHWGATRLDTKDRGSTFHPHHWAIGLAAAACLGCLRAWPASVGVGIALAVFVHGCSVYRPTGLACSWRVPCSRTKFRDVPVVPIPARRADPGAGK